MGIRVLVLFVAVGCLAAQTGVPRFRAEDVRPHGSAEPHPLVPGMLTWIFGVNLSRSSGCVVENGMDPKTYRAELCGTRVLVDGIEASLIAVLPGQINLVLPGHPWENEMVPFQIIRDGVPSAIVPVYFGFNRPVISLPQPAYAGMPVWVRVEKPWGKGWLRYPYYTEPWEIGPGSFEVRFQGQDLPLLSSLPYPPVGNGWMIGLPREVPQKYLHRVPLHLVFSLDRPGIYQVRYTEYRIRPREAAKAVHLQSEWTAIEILPSTIQMRNAFFAGLAGAHPADTVELLADYLPSILAWRDESALRLLARYLESPDHLVRTYAAYGLNYFSSDLLRRVVPGREPLRGGVR